MVLISTQGDIADYDTPLRVCNVRIAQQTDECLSNQSGVRRWPNNDPIQNFFEFHTVEIMFRKILEWEIVD